MWGSYVCSKAILIGYTAVIRYFENDHLRHFDCSLLAIFSSCSGTILHVVMLLWRGTFLFCSKIFGAADVKIGLNLHINSSSHNQICFFDALFCRWSQYPELSVPISCVDSIQSQICWKYTWSRNKPKMLSRSDRSSQCTALTVSTLTMSNEVQFFSSIGRRMDTMSQ